MRRKTEQINIRCTPKEKERLMKQANKYETSLSDYLLYERVPHSFIVKQLFKMIEEISNNDNKLENNINQIARQFNSRTYILDDTSLKELIHSLRLTANKRDQISKEMSKIISFMAHKL